MDRRKFFENLLKTTGAVSVGAGIDQLILEQLGRSGSDAFHLLRGNNFFVPKAYAQETDETALIVIKVFNLLHTPLCFKFSDYTGPVSGAYGKPWTSKISSSDTLEQLTAKGIDTRTDNPRFAGLYMNKWWASILQNGKDESGTTMEELQGHVGNFPPASDVAVQVAFHLNQTYTSQNHSFKNVTLREGGGDIADFADKQGLITSPLGIACLTMGATVETTDGSGNIANRVLGSNLATVEAQGKTVQEFVTTIRESIGAGFEDPIVQSRLDDLAGIDTSLRTNMRDTKQAIIAGKTALLEASELADVEHSMPANLHAANIQALTGSSNGTAKSEFLAQCLFVKQMLDIPNRPIRNFSLLLNVFDVDGQDFDKTAGQATNRPLSNVEGMRQLAMGLNMLAQCIRTHKNVYVAVVSEGGRGSNGGDNKVSHGMLMGPGGTGNLADHAYVNSAAVADPLNPFNTEPNEGDTSANNSPGLTVGGAGLKVYDGNELKTATGQTTTEEFADVGAFLNGIVKHLQNKSSKELANIDLGKYIDIKVSS